ncbi:unnamed protein product [Pylaiella littoralis]
MTRQSRRSPPRQEANVSRCAKDKKARLPRSTTTTNANNTGGGTLSTLAPLSDIVVEKQLLAKLALHNTSCAGCIASVRALLARPLSELRMLKAVVDEHGDGDSSSTSAFRLKGAYVNNPKRMEQLVETFPMSSVLKKVQPVGSAQRCQLHRRVISVSLGSAGSGGSSGGGGSGSGGGGGGSRGGGGSADSWYWEEAWDRMPLNLRNEVATVKASAFEAAIHHATEPSRFCPDCKYNVVQAYDILMGKIDLEDSENEEEFDKDIFSHLEDRVFDGDSGRSEDKILICDVMDVEDLIFFHEEFTSEDLDSSCSGQQQRHASTLDQGQREVRSVLGALILSQLRSVWHAQTAQVQAEQYLFCLVVDAVRTMVAAHLAAPHGDDLMARDDEERCAAEERRQKRRQKRKDRKRAGKASGVGGGDGVQAVGVAVAAVKSRGTSPSVAPTAATGPAARCSGSGRDCSSSAVLGHRTNNGVATGAAANTAAAAAGSGKLGTRRALHSHNHTSKSVEPTCSAPGLCESRGVCGGGCGGGARRSGAGAATVEEDASDGGARARITAGLNSGFAAKTLASHGGFGAGGLAFQLGHGDEDISDDDDDVDHDLITEMEQLKASVRSKSDIDFLRKTLRQNYDRFISQGAGRVR